MSPIRTLSITVAGLNMKYFRYTNICFVKLHDLFFLSKGKRTVNSKEGGIIFKKKQLSYTNKQITNQS